MNRQIYMVPNNGPWEHGRRGRIMVCDLEELSEACRGRMGNYNADPAANEVASDPTKGTVFNVERLAQFALTCIERGTLPDDLKELLTQAKETA